MKRNLSYPILLALQAAVLVALAGCIKEDLSNCPRPVWGFSVKFTDPYNGKLPEEGLNTDEFSHLTLFIYDEDNRMVATEEMYECRIDHEYPTETELPAGNYTIVAWIGAEALYYILKDIEDLKEASLSVYIPENHIIDYWVSHLYYGITSIGIHSGGLPATIPVLQFTNDINFTIEGLEDKERYTLSIRDNNGRYSFTDSFLPCPYFEYQDEPLFFSDHFETRITTLRLMDNHEPILTLADENTGEILYPAEGQEANLIHLIETAYQNEDFDFDSRHIFDFTLVFDDNLKATLFIDGWEVKENEYEI